MKALRILYLTGGYGQEHIAGIVHREMALAIRSRGHDYQILVPLPSRMASTQEDPFDEGIPVHRIPLGRSLAMRLLNRVAQPVLRNPWFPALVSAITGFLLAHKPFDVLFVEGAYPMGAAVWFARRRVRVPYVVSVLGADFLSNRDVGYGHSLHVGPRALTRFALQGAAAVRAISAYAGNGALLRGCPPERLALVPNDITAGAFLRPDEGRGTFREGARRRVAERFGLGPGRLIVAVGRLLPIKGFDILLHALRRVADTSPDVQLLLVGPDRHGSQPGSYREFLETLAQRENLAERLFVSGAVPLEEIRDLLGAADVLAVPSLEEGGNRVILEAAAVGTPFVATRSAGNAEWARAWRCGIIIEPGSAEDLATGLNMVLGSPVEAEAMGHRGLRFAEKFRTQVVADRLLALFDHAVSGGPVPAQLRVPADLLHPDSGVDLPA